MHAHTVVKHEYIPNSLLMHAHTVVKHEYIPNSSLTLETVPLVSWVSSRSWLPWGVPFGSGSASLTALTMVGMSSVVSGRVLCRLPAHGAVDFEDFLFRVDAVRVWLAFTCFLERVVGVLSMESVIFEQKVGPRLTTGPVFFFNDQLFCLWTLRLETHEL